MAALAFLLALYLRLGSEWTQVPGDTLAVWLGLFALTCAVSFVVFGLHRNIWAFASLSDLIDIARASGIGVLAFVLLAFVTTRLESIPRTVPFIAWFVMLAGMGGGRMAFRLWRERRLSVLWERSGGGRINILLVGAGDETDLFLRAISADPQAPYRVVGIIGENAKRVGHKIHGVPVLGEVEELSRVVSDLRALDRAPSRLVLTRGMARFNGALIAQLLEQASMLGLSLSRLPALTELRSDLGASSPLALRDQPVVLEDLLGRPETKLNRQDIAALVKDRRVLLTGAGGSIGSELARQIAALGPSHLALLDFGEFNLYKIDLEIREKFPDINLSAVLADVRDTARIEQVFASERPDLVFHAAAIKHVPLAEANIREAIYTNAHGTRAVADCAARAKSIAMVTISTDKAVRPSSVMGATKRLAEMYMQALDLAAAVPTRFITVRFGNVLGSTGSVVPRFQDQLAKGGPLTVTHPDVTRYFMTIREAVELVLQASTFGVRPNDKRGKVLVLDMGQPVKIADLARQMIRLAGHKPEEDIKIVYTGLRPGEKLHEELFADSEELMPSGVDGVKVAKSPSGDLKALRRALSDLTKELEGACGEGKALAMLSALVPEFDHASNR
ncbi:MAG: nucleoside-diphosphate sugar epimerase/dehydratase [Bdellovibrionales bacterium]